jgi:hypothetical protein
MRSAASCRAAVLAHGWTELVMGWTRTRGKRLQGCGSYDGDSDNDGRKKRANVVNLDPCRSIYSGVHQVRLLRLLPPYDAHHNGSIPIISREDHAGFFANRLSNDLNSEFRSSATTKRHQVTLMTNKIDDPPRHINSGL